MSKRTQYSCPVCGGTDVEMFVSGWQRANDDEAEITDLAIAELYDDWYWCPDCEAHPKSLNEKTIEVSPRLSESALRLYGTGSKMMHDHREGLMFVEEQLTLEEFAEVEAFVSWLEETNRTFGHNLPEVYDFYRRTLDERAA